jgi:uracil-DNA glycosylase family 4
MEKSQMLAMLNERVVQCVKCKELVENRTQTVFGDGSPDGICFVAEAAGRTEDSTGHVLCGPAGELFNNILNACGFKREDVYTCNIIKCRPPSNRIPTEEECNNCRPFLELQIKVVNPEYIVCLGNVAAQNLLKTKESITSLRGRWHHYKNSPVDAKVLCTYHPAFLLRNPSAKSDVWEDMQLLLEELRCLKTQA